ncbi:MAG: hypothetical protein COB24_11330 [Hyphomicrobiales bacterium]|nr:MAG: hypothetical protein COB24_11330 [Hyphomicrobiales bacterium]
MSKKRFGLESIGYISHKYSKITLTIIAVITIFMWFGQSKIVFNSNVTDLFKDDSPQYHLFEKVNNLFSGNDDEFLLTISGENLLTVENIEKLNNFQLELEFNDDVMSVLSPFSMRDFPDENGSIGPLFPAEITSDNVEQVLTHAQSHPLVGGKLLSADNQLILFVITTKKQQVDVKQGEGRGLAERDAQLALRTRLLDLAKTQIADDTLAFEMSGLSIFKAEIIGYMLYDQLVFTIFGVLFGFIISWIYFRKMKFVVLAGLPTLVAMTTMRGMFGWFEIELDVLSNIAPILIMVISFCDSVHLVYGIRRRLEQGYNRDDAIKLTVRHIGPACVLTSLTTGIAMVSLLAAGHPIISKFGFICTFGTGFAFVVTLTLIPALARLILPQKMEMHNLVTGAEPGYKHPLMHRLLDGYTEFCKTIFMRWPLRVSVLALVLVALLSYFYLQNEPRYRYVDNLPQNNEAFIGVSKIEEKLSGTNEIRIFVEFDADYNLRSEATFELYQRIEAELAQTSFVKNTFSMATVRDYVQKNSTDKSVEQFFNFIDQNAGAVDGLLLEDSKQSLVIGLLPDTDASALLPELRILEQKLAIIDEEFTSAKLYVTGILPLSAQASYSMIDMLNYSLLLAILGGVLIVTISFRSIYTGIFALIANVIPIGLAGLYLYIFDEGLQFTSVVAFTIGFGIAVDNTIHVVHRYNRAVNDGLSIEDALRKTMDSVTSVLVVTSLVLGGGIGIVMISEMPLIKLYGALLTMLVFAALLTDTLLLPSAMRLFYNHKQKKKIVNSKTSEAATAKNSKLVNEFDLKYSSKNI